MDMLMKLTLPEGQSFDKYIDLYCFVNTVIQTTLPDACDKFFYPNALVPGQCHVGQPASDVTENDTCVWVAAKDKENTLRIY